MLTKNKKKTASRDSRAATEYRGKQTKTGNSSGFRFESALFKSHPEFNGDVTAHFIARLLVTAQPKKGEDTDPIMDSFLAFLAHDIAQAPRTVPPLDTELTNRIELLFETVYVPSDAALERVIL